MRASSLRGFSLESSKELHECKRLNELSDPRVVGLYRSKIRGAAMESLPTLLAIKGHGIEGDRYSNGDGYWSFNPRFVDEITFIELEVVERVAAELKRPFEAQDSRRNVATTGIRLESLIGRRFIVGAAVFEGLRHCEPCSHLDELTGLAVRGLLLGRGGLRARVLETGTITVGSKIVVAPAIPA
jgi:hypothetical protein